MNSDFEALKSLLSGLRSDYIAGPTMGTSMILCLSLKIVCDTCELCHEKRE